jgi:ribosomal protein L11 methylase PrmA
MTDKKDDKDKNNEIDNNNSKNSDDKISELVNHLKKRQEELGLKEDTEEEIEERKRKKLEYLENKIAPYLDQWQMVGEPSLAGEQFVICRSWHKKDKDILSNNKYSGRKFIAIDPGVGFGSVHPTTLTCIEAMEKYWNGGSLLDIGTGTGLLAIVAGMLHPEAMVDAFDISLDIMEHAALQMKINGISNINLRQCTIEDYGGKTYDVVIANLLPDLLSVLKNQIVDKVKIGGLLVLSGFAEKHHGRTFAYFDWTPTVSEGMDAADIEKIFTELGMEFVEKRQTGEWVALVMKKNGEK